MGVVNTLSATITESGDAEVDVVVSYEYDAEMASATVEHVRYANPPLGFLDVASPKNSELWKKWDISASVDLESLASECVQAELWKKIVAEYDRRAS
jgi:hypothetical protein